MLDVALMVYLRSSMWWKTTIQLSVQITLRSGNRSLEVKILELICSHMSSKEGETITGGESTVLLTDILQALKLTPDGSG